jgi:ligand-binding SRPBCC domain-containing protein
MTYKLERQTLLPVGPHEAWSFFSNPRNLEKITPPDLGLRIVGDALPEEIYGGLTIHYRVTPLAGINMKWTSEILDVKAPYCFTDLQREGPYTHWKHVHRFRPAGGGTMMEDEVTYRLPLGPLGKAAHGMFVKKKLNHIFDYRAAVIEKLFARKPETAQ